MRECRRRFGSTVSIAIAATLFTASAAATDYYVDAHAVPPGNGTLVTPFVTIAQAMSLLGGPTTGSVIVAPGTYVENVVCASSMIELRSSGGPLATVIRGAVSGPVVTLPSWCGCDGDLPRVDGFTITGVIGPSGTAAVSSAEGTVRNCIITGNTGNGYYGYECTSFGQVFHTTIAGNDNGIRKQPGALVSIVTTALQNTGVNVTGNTNFTQCVGTGLPVFSNNQVVDPGFWSFASGDYHLLPGSPASAVPGGVFAGALPFDPNHAPDSFAFCFGDGTLVDHTTPCPCGNSGAAGRGCASGANPSGARLAAGGQAYLDSVVLYASGMPASAYGLYLQHDAADDRVFHDGVLCAGGNLLRLRNRNAVSGASQFPDPNFAQDATLTLSQRGLVTPGSGALRHYSVFYRSPAATFCPPATANVTNGWRVVW